MSLEADLGIDSIKRVEGFGYARAVRPSAQHPTEPPSRAAVPRLSRDIRPVG
jgi:hypothetical protein